MNIILKLVLILGIAMVPACAAPPNETEAERTSRYNGITVGLAIVTVTTVVLGVLFAEGFKDGMEGILGGE